MCLIIIIHVHDFNKKGEHGLFFKLTFDVTQSYVLYIIKGITKCEKHAITADKGDDD